MILVTVGTQKFPMDRLIQMVDRLVERGVITEPVLMQTGHSRYQPAFCKAVSLLPSHEMDEQLDRCSLLICHAGVGSMLSGIRRGKITIAVPRLAAYGEHVDDHQEEIAQAFTESGYTLTANTETELEQQLERAKSWKPKEFVSNTDRYIQLLSDLLGLDEP
ncbi:MAG: PssE/Cps14G family polysaccharide biosynthesis glycosyltransferase [Butyricicoccus sp.]